jgi:hypothetical protein
MVPHPSLLHDARSFSPKSICALVICIARTRCHEFWQGILLRVAPESDSTHPSQE